MFWRRELEEPALLIKTRIEKLGSALDDDAPLGRAATERSSASLEGPPRKVQKIATMPRGERVRLVDTDGNFTANRRGIPLRTAFQKGERGPSDSSGVCPRDPSKMHQCSRCLLLGHGRHQCRVQEPRRDNTSRGKGKGKGRGKGRRRP